MRIHGPFYLQFSLYLPIISVSEMTARVSPVNHSFGVSASDLLWSKTHSLNRLNSSLPPAGPLSSCSWGCLQWKSIPFWGACCVSLCQGDQSGCILTLDVSLDAALETLGCRHYLKHNHMVKTLQVQPTIRFSVVSAKYNWWEPFLFVVTRFCVLKDIHLHQGSEPKSWTMKRSSGI